MRQLLFVTGNKNKFRTARIAFQDAGIKLIQANHEIDEIQGEDTEHIARDKAQKAFAIVKAPLIINDDSWSIPGLNGFPGPYMKSINQWFTPADFLRLTKDLKDRRIILTQIVIYQDEVEQKVFTKTTNGTLRKDISPYDDAPSARIKSVTADGRALAEVRATSPEQLVADQTIWHEVAEWLVSRP